jgi:hypothetical protein
MSEKSWIQVIDGKQYMEWRYLARKKLDQLQIYREMDRRWCNDSNEVQYPSDELYIEAIRECMKSYFLVLNEMDNPIPI